MNEQGGVSVISDAEVAEVNPGQEGTDPSLLAAEQPNDSATGGDTSTDVQPLPFDPIAKPAAPVAAGGPPKTEAPAKRVEKADEANLSPSEKLLKMNEDDGIIVDFDVLTQILKMEQDFLLSSPSRTAELAGMTMGEIMQTPEYKLGAAQDIANDKQRILDGDHHLDDSFIQELKPQKEALKAKLAGKTVDQVFGDIDFDDEAFADLLDESIFETEESLTEAEKALADEAEGFEDAIDANGNSKEERMKKAEEKLKLKREARMKRASFKARVLGMIGEVMDKGMRQTDIGGFIDFLFSGGEARGQSWGRYDQKFAGREDGEMIGPGEVREHFKSKRNLVDTLHRFYSQLKANPELSYIKKPEGLVPADEFEKMTPEQLHDALIQLSSLLTSQITKSDSKIISELENSILDSMGKNRNDFMVESRIYLELIEIGNPNQDRQESFKEFMAQMRE